MDCWAMVVARRKAKDDATRVGARCASPTGHESDEKGCGCLGHLILILSATRSKLLNIENSPCFFADVGQTSLTFLSDASELFLETGVVAVGQE